MGIRGAPPRLALGALGWLGFWTAATLVAVLLAKLLEGQPAVGLVPAALVVGALLSYRFPLIALLALVLMSGTYATLRVTIHVQMYTLMEGALAAMWLAALAGLVTRRRALRPVLWPGAALVAFLAVVSLGWVLLSDSSGSSYEGLWSLMGAWRTEYWFMLAALLVAYAPWQGVNSNRMARVVLVGGAVVAGYAVLRWQIGPSSKEAHLANQVGRGYTQADNGDLRPLGGVGDTHGLSSLMVPLIPFSFALLLALRDRWRLLAGLVLGLSGLTLAVTQVRAGMASAAIGMIVVLGLLLLSRSLGARRLAAAYIGVVLALGIVAAVVVFQGGGGQDRTKPIQAILTPERDRAYQERLFVWGGALREIDKRPFGHGLGTADTARKSRERFTPTGGRGTGDVVNSYLRIAYEQGVVFAALFIATLIAILLGLVRTALLARTETASTLSVAAAGTLVAFAVELNFESIYIAIGTVALSWVIIGLGMRQLSWEQPANGAGRRARRLSAQNAGFGRPAPGPAALITPNPRSAETAGDARGS